MAGKCDGCRKLYRGNEAAYEKGGRRKFKEEWVKEDVITTDSFGIISGVQGESLRKVKIFPSNTGITVFVLTINGF